MAAHHLRPQLLGVDPQDGGDELGGRGHPVPGDHLGGPAGGGILLLLGALELGDQALVGADVVGDGRGGQDRPVPPEDRAARRPVDSRDGALGFRLEREGGVVDHLDLDGLARNHHETCQAEQLEGPTTAGIHRRATAVDRKSVV